MPKGDTNIILESKEPKIEKQLELYLQIEQVKKEIRELTQQLQLKEIDYKASLEKKDKIINNATETTKILLKQIKLSI